MAVDESGLDVGDENTGHQLLENILVLLLLGGIGRKDLQLTDATYKIADCIERIWFYQREPQGVNVCLEKDRKSLIVKKNNY